MNPRLLVVAGLVAVGILGSGVVPASASKQPAPSTTVPRLAAKASLPEPVSVSALEDLDGDGIVDTAPGAPTVAAAPAVSANGWRCPVSGSKFTNDYGSPRSGGRAHAGTDMLVARGTPIFAPIAGTVKFDSSALGGLSFYLDTPGGLQLYGAHLSAYGTAGPVESGTIIGYVGDTGNAKGTPHLHFEVHPTKKTTTNPYPLLKQIC